MGNKVIYAVIINIFVFTILALVRLYMKCKNESIYDRVRVYEVYAYTPNFKYVPALDSEQDTSRFFEFFGDSGFILDVLQPDLHNLPIDRPVYLSREIGGGFYEVYHFDTCCWGAQHGITHANYLHREPIPQPMWDSIIDASFEIDSLLDIKYGPMRTNRPSPYGVACWW